ncbi:MAG: hypothetical protein NTY22_01535 [Proteobacteria bacterium]|nr:hypothetical protein [Pseudomonadota bacterium]
MKKGVILIALPLFMIACSGGGSGVGSLDKLPKMTNPVMTAGVSGSSVKINKATTGTTFWGGSFTTGNSRQMCETFNLSRESLDQAAQADKVLCYVQNTLVAPANSASFNAINPYDGKTHILQLDFGTSPNPDSNITKPKMKLKIVKDGDKIKEFEMFMCMGGSDNDHLAQSQYLHQVITDGNVTITNKDISTHYSNHMSVTGKLNSDSQFTEKEITAVNYSNNTYGINSSKAVFDQFLDSIIVSAYQKGTWSVTVDTIGVNSYTTRMYAKFELLNGSSTDTHKWAMGDGSINVSMSNTNPGCPDGTCSYDDKYSWLGDTKAVVSPASGGMFYSAVSGATLPTTDPTSEASTIGFDASETWDCSGTAEVPIVVDQAALDPICDILGFKVNGSDSWIDCYSTTGQ